MRRLVYASAQASLRICFPHPQDRFSRSEAQIFFLSQCQFIAVIYRVSCVQKNISIEHYVSYDENNKLKLSYCLWSLLPATFRKQIKKVF